MPGKQPREGEPPLVREQSVIAAAILRREFDPANTQMARRLCVLAESLLAEINAAFVAQGLPPTYSLRKMEDWRANCIYRWKRRRQQEQAQEAQGQEEQEQAQALEAAAAGGQLPAPAPTLAGGASALPSMLGLASSLSRPLAAAPGPHRPPPPAAAASASAVSAGRLPPRPQPQPQSDGLTRRSFRSEETEARERLGPPPRPGSGPPTPADDGSLSARSAAAAAPSAPWSAAPPTPSAPPGPASARSSKKPWDDDEDMKILELVQVHGAKSWPLIAEHLPGRVGKQCRER